MTEIRYVQSRDKDFWYRLDKHLPESEFDNKVSRQEGYVLLENGCPVGLLRYNLFWDNTPFCNLLFVEQTCRGKGYGRELMAHWEQDMQLQGYTMVMTSTQADEQAQHFYRKLGYKDCGGFVLDGQPMELIMVKILG